MEHPSISRLHAVLQFRASDGAAFLYDPGSAHGTVVNKKRIPAQQYVPLRCAGTRAQAILCHQPQPEASRQTMSASRQQRI